MSGLTLSFTDIYEAVFENNGCANGYCHSAPFEGLNFLTVDDAYAALVNQVSPFPQCEVETYVVPGDPEASLLWHKVRPATDEGPWCGEKMPLGTLGLSEAAARSALRFGLGRSTSREEIDWVARRVVEEASALRASRAAGPRRRRRSRRCR